MQAKPFSPTGPVTGPIPFSRSASVREVIRIPEQQARRSSGKWERMEEEMLSAGRRKHADEQCQAGRDSHWHQRDADASDSIPNCVNQVRLSRRSSAGSTRVHRGRFRRFASRSCLADRQVLLTLTQRERGVKHFVHFGLKFPDAHKQLHHVVVYSGRFDRVLRYRSRKLSCGGSGRSRCLPQSLNRL